MLGCISCNRNWITCVVSFPTPTLWFRLSEMLVSVNSFKIASTKGFVSQDLLINVKKTFSFIFCPNNLYSTLISRITLKLVTAFIFSWIGQSLKNAKSALFRVWNQRELSIFFALVHKNGVISLNEIKSQNKHRLVLYNSAIIFR